MTDIRERVLLPLNRDTRGTESIDDKIDVAPLFLHLLLFEKVILRSTRLSDVAELVRVLGAEQTIELLESGCVDIRAEADTIGFWPTTDNEVRLMTVSVDEEKESYLSGAMRDAFDMLGLKFAVSKKLKRAVVRRRLTHSPAYLAFGRAAIDEAYREALMNSPMFQRALEHSARKYGKGITIPEGAIRSEMNGENLRFDARGVAGPPEVIAEVVRRACLAATHLSAEFGHMQRDNAITALDEDSTAAMELKMAFLWRGNSNDPTRRTGTFARLLDAIDLPDFGLAVRDKGINVENFLRVRETAECKDFRTFLHKAEDLDAAELRSRTESLRARVGNAAKSTTGKALRFLATTAAGIIPVVGLATGAAAGAFDSFLVEKLLPSSGVVAFVGKQYPSIFERK